VLLTPVLPGQVWPAVLIGKEKKTERQRQKSERGDTTSAE